MSSTAYNIAFTLTFRRGTCTVKNLGADDWYFPNCLEEMVNGSRIQPDPREW
jgi:hypothetical protein